jgi:3-phenylpropionate/trans-cinnamate dioxygenase ferredoxin reductase subunit
MPEDAYKYIIIGGGLAGASAVEGIRQIDKDGAILLIGDERHMPYDRPPLTKKLWFGNMAFEKVFLKDEAFYKSNGVALKLGVRAAGIYVKEKSVMDAAGGAYHYERLLVATGGAPRRLPIPGGDLEGICYYRYLDDYLRVREKAVQGATAAVIGGGFIGSEIAAALNMQGVDVTMIFPSEYLCDRVFPDYLGTAIQRHYVERGIKVLAGDMPVSIERAGEKFITHTASGKEARSDILIAGVGIEPETGLAGAAGLRVGNGIEVNEYLMTSGADVYAAGDNASFPYQALGIRTRVEHWDNALTQGRFAGRNMAGAGERYDYMPYFFSDLFEFGYEAVGEVSSKLETLADWQKENEKGVIYYLKDGVVRGAMMCDVWDKVPAARELIRSGTLGSPERLRGAIK